MDENLHFTRDSISPVRPSDTWMDQSTRKLCYRKDDRAMRPIHGCPENFRDSLTTPTAIISNIFSSMAFVRIDPMNVHT